MTEAIILINGNECSFSGNQTILEVAQAHDIQIPTLCYLKGTTPTGRCGICVVEVEGSKELLSACSTIASDHMFVRTESPAVIASRKDTIAMLLATGNHNCAIASTQESRWTSFQMGTMKADDAEQLCPAWGDCRLQDLAYQYQVKGGGEPRIESKFPMEMVNPLIVRDFSRCILCGRCVAACNEIQVNRAIAFGDSGPVKKIVTPGDRPLKDSDCVFCGECIQACPTGALVEKKARFHWRPREIQKVRSTCPYCGVGCQVNLHVKDDKIVKVTGVEDGAPNKGRLCVKGRFGYDFIYSKDRLKTPLIRENGGFREASWDEALDLVADKFKAIIAEHGPDAIAGVSCARSISEDSYQMQKLFRSVFKTNNIDHCART
ncbi:Molybdopterin oxidoreductase Fe4S4 region [uncultured Desulfobacterium sp.]|uniref:Molybdopterin oxidoreductase Fe4S4 region n=1 Tax=uncultured Desulfobacterium sp. TaxID=201089 RepID=A0A445N1B7_9BACT|nr:Molybdopterin oxidoreductase Fe4S4 region [uncultured Desulfobacterium sp.]